MGTSGKVFVWHRKKQVTPEVESWLPRFTHPFVYASNGEEVVRIKDADLGGLRTHENAEWDYNPTSAAFRRRIQRAEAQVRAGGEAFKPNPTVLVDHWSNMADFRNEGPFEECTMYLITFGPRWDIVKVDEWVGDTLYENRPFQTCHPECVKGRGRARVGHSTRGLATGSLATDTSAPRLLCATGGRTRTRRSTTFPAATGSGL